MKKIITISREFGAGGGEIASKLASDLGWEYYDKALIFAAARESNMDVKEFVEWDEKVPVQFGFTQSLFDLYNKPLSEKIVEGQKKAIRDFANKGNCIIVGRNANNILKEFDHSIHIFIMADLNWRIERMKGRMPDIPENKVADYIKAIDKCRAKYCLHNTKTTFGDADNYDLCLSTSKLGIEKCVEIIKSVL